MARTTLKRDCLIRYPGFGELWLRDAKLTGDMVVGEARLAFQSPKPMNFPRSAIVRWRSYEEPLR
jgi:hypothetical protein